MSSSAIVMYQPLSDDPCTSGRSVSFAEKRRFAGLSNQGATCYMNSLLQTLYMTPEFRKAIYDWKMEDEEDHDTIPAQMQNLFGQLQLTDQDAVDTKALTDSFGWTSADAFQQQDVQELCRVLFDALERAFKATPSHSLIDDLYKGTMLDYVRCKECHNESSRADDFLDLSLVIRPFGSAECVRSVREGLELLLRPELLEGDNQYRCEKCAKKCDAVKGLKFKKLPYMLALQLKRFDFDYETFERVKLNHEVRFPATLDLNRYVVVDDDELQAAAAEAATAAGAAAAGDGAGVVDEKEGGGG